MNKKKKLAPAQKSNQVMHRPGRFLERFGDHVYWHLALLILLPFFLYIKVTGFEFIQLDDVSIIRNNFNIIGNIRNVGMAFRTDAFLAAHGDFYRPLQTVSFMIDAMIGGEKPWIYHLSNLVYHLLTVISLYYFLRSLGIRSLVALFMALFFSVHPLLSATVSWIPARGDLLVCLFGVQLFITFRKYFQTGKVIYLLLNILFFLAAIFSKETAIVFPVLLLFYYFLVLKEKFNFRKLALFFIAWLLILIVFYLLRSSVATAPPPDFVFGLDPFIKNLPLIPIVIAKFFIPVNLSTMPLYENNFIIIGTVIFLALVILTLKFTIRKSWLVTMGFIWFMVFIIPPMFFKIVYSHYVVEYYEHRTYLPLIGLFIIAGFILNNKLFGPGNNFINLLPVVLIGIFAFIASSHSDHFRNSLTFFSRASELNNPGAYTKRGELYFEQRDYSSALADFETAVDISDAQYPPAFFNRGKVRAQFLKDHKLAEEDYTKVIGLDPRYIDAYINRANERISTGNFPGALQDIETARKIDSLNPGIYHTLGGVYINMKENEKSIAAYTREIALDSFSAEAYSNRGFAEYQLKKYTQALKDCNKALEIFPQFLNARYNKGMIYYEMGQPDTAIKHFDTTLMLADNFYFGYFYRGMAKKQKNDMAGACKDWQESVKLGFTMAQDTINRYCK